MASLDHDISTVSGEEFVIFTLTKVPLCREAKKNQLAAWINSSYWTLKKGAAKTYGMASLAQQAQPD